MRRISLGRCVPWAAPAFMVFAFNVPVLADQGGAIRREIAEIGQVTGKDPYEAQLAALLNDLNHAKKLVAAGVEMAKANDPNLSYSGALALGQLAAELKDFQACENLYRVCMTAAVKLYSPAKISESYGSLINALYDGEKYADARRICSELLEIKTTDAIPRKYYYIIEDRFGDFGFQEDTDFDVTHDLRPAVHQIMIQALAKEGKYDQALKLTDNLVRASDGWRERQLRAWVLGECGRFAEAAKVYEDVLERIPKDQELTQKGKDFYSDRYRPVLVNVYVDAKQIDKAAEHLKILIDRHPDDPSWYNDLGYIWADNDMNIKEAEELIRKALDMDRDQRKKSPDFNAAEDHDKGTYLDSLGWVLFKQKRYDDAKKYLIEALKDKDAQHLEVFDHLGETYIALGQREAALNAWRRGLEVVRAVRTDKERKLEVEKKIEKNQK
jgi:tetratricopeptide (TPR) repeat protein